MTRYAATITHHSIARARIVPVGDSLTAAKRAASREFGGEMQDYEIRIIDTTAPVYGDDPVPGNQATVAWRKVGDTKWQQ